MKRVLFVDVRNATRSPIAEAWFNHLAGNQAKASSCGTLPAERISACAVQVMRETGVDIHRQFPRPITPHLLDDADIVVFMGTGIYPRVHHGIRVWDLSDPAGGSLEHVRELRDRIRIRVEQLIAEIAYEGAAPAWIEWDGYMPSLLQA